MLAGEPEFGVYDGFIVAVAHDEYRENGAAEVCGCGRENRVRCDLRGIFARYESDLSRYESDL